MSNPSPPVIKASELAEYGFCRRAWWLRHVKQINPQNQANLSRGRKMHARHGQRVRAVSRWRWVGFALFGVGILVLVAVLSQMMG